MTDLIFAWFLGLVFGVCMSNLESSYDRSQSIKAGVMVVDGQAYVLLPVTRRGE